MPRFDLPQLYRTSRGQHYESFYLKLCRPGGGETFWIRYTLMRREDGQKTASIWCTHFDTELQRPQAFKQTFDPSQFSLEQNDNLLEIGSSTFKPGHAHGEVSRDGSTARWDLSFEQGRPPFYYLSKERMYEGAFPRTKYIAPYPQTRFNGVVVIDGKEIKVDGWPGMIGHNWGTEHARRWVWLNCNEFEGEGDDTFFDGGAGRTRVGRWTAPWLSSGIAVVRGREYLFNSPTSSLRGRVNETHTSCELTLKSPQATAIMRVSAPSERFVGYLYQDPTGDSRHTLNCSIADAELELIPKGDEPIRLRAKAAAAYELGILPNEQHAVPIEPFPDY